MKINLKFFSCVLLVCLVLSFSCLAFAEENAAQLYSCISLSMAGERFDASDVYPAGCTLELGARDSALLNLDGTVFPCTWQREGSGLSLELGENHYSGTFSGNVLEIVFDGIGFTFLRSGSPVPELPENAEKTGASTGGLSMWNGDWYGQWRIFNASGIWTEFDGMSYDCFSRVLVGEDALGHIILWDEKLSADDPMAELEISIVGASENIMGAAMVDGGWFWQMEPESGIWGFGSNIAGFDRLIALENAHYESEEGSFDFTVLLRPWGFTWEDVAEIDPHSLPFYYYDWYLPMLEQGQGMPARFDREINSGADTGENKK